MSATSSLLRQRGRQDGARVTMVELFFDLVFVFAVTQLSHTLLAHLTLAGALKVVLLLLAVWWVWIYTSWVTNWLDPERVPVRLGLYVLMLAGLILAVSIPGAFAGRASGFAGAYVLMQVGRSLFMLAALKGHSPANYRNFQRITCWLVFSAMFWIAGAAAAGGARLMLWAAALVIEYVSPAIGFWTPRLGRSTTADWDVAGGHIAERCGLFIIIALGESILVTGATFAGLTQSPGTIAAFVASFIGSVAMWWVYFDKGAERGSRRIASAGDPGRLARIGYTYIHLVMVAGIIVAAVADARVLAHPLGPTEPASVAVILGGPALFLGGTALFKWVMFGRGRPPLSHLVGLALLALLVAAAMRLSPLPLEAAADGVLIVVAVWETLTLGDPAGRGVPEPEPASAGRRRE